MRHVHEYTDEELLAVLKFAFIDNFNDEIPIRKVSREIFISPDTYYNYRKQFRDTNDLSILNKLPSSAMIYFVKAYNKYH